MNIFYKTIISYGYKRLKESSTWRSIIYLIGGAWAIKYPDQVEAIIPIAIAISGLVGSFFPDIIGKQPNKKQDEKQNLPEIELVGKSEKNNYNDIDSNVNIVPNNKNNLQTNNRPEPKGDIKQERDVDSGFGFNDK